ncbi:hypothetical protein KAR91_02610 [Candidatus Pacearchaeota archaeon]|nr:hypothetical protein [Candidatus Pacearchaeota archaeon]
MSHPNTFAECTTKEEALALVKTLNTEANATIRRNNKAKNDRLKELRREELAPFEDEAKRWQPGQKVYFATGIESFAMDWNFNTVKGSEKKIQAGQWCRVWQYQPKSKRLWLCRPGTKCERKNVIRDSFSLTSIKELGISRTELELRK